MSEIVMTGLDGKNPLAFLAALGVLDAVSDGGGHGAPATMRWEQRGSFTPVLEAALDLEVLLDILERDRVAISKAPVLNALKYPKGGSGTEAHDLKPPPEVFADYLRRLVDGFVEAMEDERIAAARGLRLASAFATDVAVDNNGNTKPTALHFTAGQQEFLAMVDELASNVSREDLREALLGPWSYSRPLPVLQWDNTSAREYALRASDPSKEKKLGVPGADWLAFRGLAFLPVAPEGARIRTTACRGEWKTGAFRWPIWSTRISRRVVASLMTSPELFDSPAGVLEARGVDVVFEAAIRRSEQGGYGSFTPASVASRIARD